MADKQTLVSANDALPGRDAPLSVEATHFVNQTNIFDKPTESQQEVIFGLGCFWGAERLFWKLEGVVSTSVGYAGALLKTQPMRKSVPDKLVIQKWCAWYSTRRLSRLKLCYRHSGKITIQLRGCVRAMTSVLSIAAQFT